MKEHSHLRIWKSSVQKLKEIREKTGQSMVFVIDRLAQQELDKLQIGLKEAKETVKRPSATLSFPIEKAISEGIKKIEIEPAVKPPVKPTRPNNDKEIYDLGKRIRSDSMNNLNVEKLVYKLMEIGIPFKNRSDARLIEGTLTAEEMGFQTQEYINKWNRL